MPELLRSPHWVVTQDPIRAIVVVARTAEPFTSVADIHAAAAPVHRALQAVTRARYGLLVDMRNAPLRNDPQFESAMAEHRRQIAQGFGRCAVLLSSMLGKLQIQRLSRSDGIEWTAFDSLDAAMEHLASRARG